MQLELSMRLCIQGWMFYMFVINWRGQVEYNLGISMFYTDLCMVILLRRKSHN